MSAVFSHGRLRLYLLKLLDEGPKHGYELIRLLENRFHGLYAPSAGTIYPRLARMEADGLITHTAAGGRKVYEITDAGRAELRRAAGELATAGDRDPRLGGRPGRAGRRGRERACAARCATSSGSCARPPRQTPADPAGEPARHPGPTPARRPASGRGRSRALARPSRPAAGRVHRRGRRVGPRPGRLSDVQLRTAIRVARRRAGTGCAGLLR